jgi:hypothetical protein
MILMSFHSCPLIGMLMQAILEGGHFHKDRFTLNKSVRTLFKQETKTVCGHGKSNSYVHHDSDRASGGTAIIIKACIYINKFITNKLH